MRRRASCSRSDGVQITSVKDIRNELGEATLTIARAPGTKGISGTGAVLMLNFTAIGKGDGHDYAARTSI